MLKKNPHQQFLMFIDKVFTCVMYKQQEHQVTVSYIHINIHLLVYNTIQLCKQHYLLAQELDLLALSTSVKDDLLQYNVQKTSINYNLQLLSDISRCKKKHE